MNSNQPERASDVTQIVKLVLCGWVLYFASAMPSNAGQADLGVYFNSFFPSFVNAGEHPIQVAFRINNIGPDAVGGAVPVRVEMFFSRNSTFGDGDDFSIGSTSVADAIPANSHVDKTLDSVSGAAAFTVPFSACGDYYAFMRVSSSYSDPDTFDNVNNLPFTIFVTPSGPAPTVQSVVRRVPTASVVSTNKVVWRATFSQPVTGVDAADFTVSRLSGSISGYSVTQVQLPSSTTADVTVTTGPGNGDLRLDVPPTATIYNACGQRLALSFSGGQVYTFLRTGPTVLSITPVSPDPTHGPVSSLDVVFSAPISLATFTYLDMTLTRDGNPIVLNSTVVTSLVSGSTYRINNLAVFTASAGNFVIAVNGSGITDSIGNSATGSASDSWNNILAGDQPVYVNKAYAGTDANGALLSPFKTVGSGYQAAQTNNTITIFSGNYPEALINMNKPLVLQATNGVVNIGIP